MESNTIAYEGKGEEFEEANAIWRHGDFLSVVPIGGAIVHPR